MRIDGMKLAVENGTDLNESNQRGDHHRKAFPGVEDGSSPLKRIRNSNPAQPQTAIKENLMPSKSLPFWCSSARCRSYEYELVYSSFELTERKSSAFTLSEILFTPPKDRLAGSISESV